MSNPIQLDLFSDSSIKNTKTEKFFSPPNELTVYEASAGSGKTHTLMLEYLKQALSDDHNVNKFRTILAVTFTNKATSEMKKRIISALDNIVKKRDRDSDRKIRDSICSRLNIDEKTLITRATRVQHAILHHYSNFSISTIDKFFQRVVHAFVREAGLRPGFRLELDNERLMAEAVDRMMMNLHKNEFLYSRVSHIINDQMEKGRSWDIRRNLKDRGSELLKEKFRTLDSRFHLKIRDTDFMYRFIEEIDTIIKDFEKELYKLADFAILQIVGNGYDKSDFDNNSPVNYFYKLKKEKYEIPGKKVYDLLESGNDEAWGKFIDPQTAGILTTLLQSIVTLYKQKCQQYFTAKCVKNAMGSLVFFAELEANIREITNDENLLPISETVHLLQKLINESDTPFIYEMTGSQYNTFMIDEFQDTSEAQWKNFKPLLKNSLSEGKNSLVVGDVKQSIYRWRNGDWSILAHKIFNEFGNFNVNAKNLDTNWRSFPNVIKFNNALFSALPAYIEDKFPAPDGIKIDILSAVYKNAEQKISEENEKKGGYVSVSLVRNEEKDGVKIKAKDKILKRLPKIIVDMQDRGYRASDIAILVRDASDGQEISDCLLNYKKTSGDTQHCFDIISTDALLLKKSPTVQFIISLMWAIVNPDDKINNVSINCFLNRDNPAFKWDNSAVLDDNMRKQLLELTSLSLPEVFEHLVRIYNLGDNPLEVPYIQELHDMLISFVNSKISDISSFVEYWDDEGMDTKLSQGEITANAITITTIHKAKGLEFPVVIIPFCNWKMKPDHRDTIWVSPSKEPFNQLSHIIANYGKDMENSYFDKEYRNEIIQSLVDNLNLLYVAFTRAKEELHVMLPLSALPKNNSSKADIIGAASSTIASFLDAGYMNVKLQYYRTKGSEDFRYDLGEKQQHQNNSVSKNNSNILIENYNSSDFDKKLRLKYESENYFPEQGSPLQLRNYGILMHRVFSLVRSAKDVPVAIDRIVKDGLIGNADVLELKRRVEKALCFAGQWFADDNAYEIITEKFLLLPASLNKGLSRRPDRIMLSENETVLVDYKFGALRKESHKVQVKDYMQLLETMKYPNVKGYVWYVDMDLIDEITENFA
jgi:ATP-dependent exoDNAse (exonuclease V) beta subunit